MKLKVITSLIFVWVIVSQVVVIMPVWAGVNGGVLLGCTQSWLSPGAMMNTENYADISKGVFLSVDLGKRICIQPSVLRVRRGGTYPRMPSYPSGEDAEFGGADYRIDYYEFPLLVRYCITKKGCVRPELIAGPAWCSIRGSSLKSREYHSGEWARGYDMALYLGIGVNAWAGETQWGVDLLYRAPLSEPSEVLLFPDATVAGVSVLVRVGI